MKKKFRPIVATLLAMAMCFSFFAACDKGGDNKKEADYVIDVKSLVLPAAEIQKTYTLAIPKVVDKDGNAMEGKDYAVTVKGVSDPDNKSVAVQAGKFLIPSKAGTYTVTYTCAKEGVEDAAAAFSAIDSEKPKISRGLVTEFAIKGNPVPVPVFNVTDNNDLPDGAIVMEITDPSGKKIEPKDGWFTPDVAGNWKYKVTVTDAGNNVVSDEMDLYVADTEVVADKIAYLDEPELALKQAKSFDDRNQDISYVTHAEMPAGSEEFPKPSASEMKGGLKITPAEGVKHSLTINNVLYDWSKYDYIGFWAYNNTNNFMTLNTGIANTQNEQLSPGAWQFIAIWCAGDEYNERWDTLQKKDHVVEWALFDDLGQSTGDLYVGPISGYKFGEDDKVMALDQPGGRMFFTPHMAHRAVSTYFYTPTVKDETDAKAQGSMKIILTDTVKTWQMRIQKAVNIPKGYEEENKNFFVTAWVKNPLDKDIIVYCEKYEDGKEVRMETTVPAGQSAYVKLALRSDKASAWTSFDDNPWQFFFLSAEYKDGSSFVANDAFYIGGFTATEIN